MPSLVGRIVPNWPRSNDVSRHNSIGSILVRGIIRASCKITSTVARARSASCVNQ